MTSAYRRVWININCLTDHHQPNPPQSLQRLAGTDVWYWQTELSGARRAATALSLALTSGRRRSAATMRTPTCTTCATGGTVFASATPICSTRIAPAKRQRPQRLRSAYAGCATAAGMALVRRVRDRQRALYATAAGAFAAPYRQSERPGNSRDVWIYTTGDSKPAERPLAILLDGQFWAKQMPVWEPLMQLTREGALPEAVYVLIDIIDLPHRSRELTCKDDFWLAVQEELMPQLADWAPHSGKPADTVVAGQSFGGPASLYAGLRWPQRFGAVIAQSGSYWWRGATCCSCRAFPTMPVG